VIVVAARGALENKYGSKNNNSFGGSESAIIIDDSC
jgi:hypothetical protein